MRPTYQVVEPARPAVEVAAVSAVKHVEAVHGVLGRVAVHDVEQHHETSSVCGVNQPLQRGGTSIPAMVMVLLPGI